MHNHFPVTDEEIFLIMKVAVSVLSALNYQRPAGALVLRQPLPRAIDCASKPHTADCLDKDMLHICSHLYREKSVLASLPNRAARMLLRPDFEDSA